MLPAKPAAELSWAPTMVDASQRQTLGKSGEEPGYAVDVYSQDRQPDALETDSIAVSPMPSLGSIETPPPWAKPEEIESSPKPAPTFAAKPAVPHPDTSVKPAVPHPDTTVKPATPSPDTSVKLGSHAKSPYLSEACPL